MDYSFKLTDADLEIINRALIQAPYGAVVELIQKINKQMSEQKENSPDNE